MAFKSYDAFQRATCLFYACRCIAAHGLTERTVADSMPSSDFTAADFVGEEAHIAAVRIDRLIRLKVATN